MGLIQNSKGEMGLFKFKNKIKMILKFRIFIEINPKIKDTDLQSSISNYCVGYTFRKESNLKEEEHYGFLNLRLLKFNL